MEKYSEYHQHSYGTSSDSSSHTFSASQAEPRSGDLPSGPSPENQSCKQISTTWGGLFFAEWDFTFALGLPERESLFQR